MKKKILGMVVLASLLAGCQNSPKKTVVQAPPAKETFIDYHNRVLEPIIASDIVDLSESGSDNEVVILFDGDKSFNFGSSTIKPESKQALLTLARVLKNNSTTKVFIGGHTDDQGTEAFNLSLSNERADSVLQLLEDNGVKSNRLTKYGYGELEPIATNATREGRQKNRRIEIRLSPTL